MSDRKAIGGKRLLVVRLALLDAAEWQDSIAASLRDSDDPRDIENQRNAKSMATEYRKIHEALS